MKTNLICSIAAMILGASVATAFAGSAADDVKVMDPWAREVPPVVSTSAGFMVMENQGDTAHELVAATSPGSGMVELHTHINDNGVMRMRQVESIKVEAGSKTTLQPGGLHLMLMMLKNPLKAGDKLPITLEFKDGSKIDIQAEVRQFDMKKPAGHMH